MNEVDANNSTPTRSLRFGGIDRLYGAGAVEKLHAAHVAVIGLGGVGSWTVEALARSGIGMLTLIDMDDVCITNTNRQLPAVAGSIGQPKAGALADRIRSINPECRVVPVIEFFTPATCERLLQTRYDFVVDCTDRMSVKALIIGRCHERGMQVLTVGGSGGRRDATLVRAGDLGRTGGDMLLKLVRRKLRSDYGWAKGNNHLYGVPAVFSAEPQVYPHSDGQVCDTPEPGTIMKMDCASGFGAACFVTGTFGFVAAGEVVGHLLHQK